VRDALTSKNPLAVTLSTRDRVTGAAFVVAGILL